MPDFGNLPKIACVTERGENLSQRFFFDMKSSGSSRWQSLPSEMAWSFSGEKKASSEERLRWKSI
jgi:hypothetical protein